MILRIKKMQSHLPPIQGKIEFDNVSFSYEKEGETILNSINLVVNPGKPSHLSG